MGGLGLPKKCGDVQRLALPRVRDRKGSAELHGIARGLLERPCDLEVADDGGLTKRAATVLSPRDVCREVVLEDEYLDDEPGIELAMLERRGLASHGHLLGAEVGVELERSTRGRPEKTRELGTRPARR